MHLNKTFKIAMFLGALFASILLIETGLLLKLSYHFTEVTIFKKINYKGPYKVRADKTKQPGDPRKKSFVRSFFYVLLSGPIALIVSLVVVLAVPLWYPPGPGKVDNLVLPVLLFPLIWVILFVHACMDRRLLRVSLILLALFVINGSMIALKFTGKAF